MTKASWQLPQLLVAVSLGALGFPSPGTSVVPIGATTQGNLGFGQIVATTVAGTVTVSPVGSRTSSGGVLLGNGLGVSAATFAVIGEPNASFSITLPTPCTLSSGGSSMTLDSFTSHPNGSGNLGPAGSQSVTLGATLHVGAAQAAAAYSGSYNVTVAYN
ncbi:MAG: DUF4402 domain-containing protein [Acidobacteriota bacterium]